MKMFKGLFFIIFIVNIRTSSCVLEALYEAGQQVWKLWTIIDNRGIEVSLYTDTPKYLSSNPIIREMKKKADVIYESLNELEKFMGSKKIQRTIKSWVYDASTLRELDVIELFVEAIDKSYTKFNQNRNETYYADGSFEVLMKNIFLDLKGDILLIRKFAAKEEKSLPNEKGLVTAIAGYILAHGAEICEASQVIPNILIQLFQMIIIAELKTSTMLAYENIYEYVMSKDKQELQKINLMARKELEEQFAIYINLFLSNMAVIDGVYNRACDPPGGNWTRDESFYELEKTFQAIVFRYDRLSCRTESCNYVNNEKPYGCRPLFCTEPVFESTEDTVAECAYLSHTKACVLKSGPYRYQYVQSSQLGFLGRNSPCPKDNGEVIETTRTPLVSYAACACNFNSSHNKISLFMIESTVDANRVITGLRFIRKNEILYIQPREGTLKSNGFIDHHSQRWITIPRNIHSSLIEPINKKNSVFFLDDLTLPINYVLTGVRFNKVTRGDVTGFAIEILGTLFNYRTGKLLFLGDSRRLLKGSNEESGKSLSFNPVSSVFTTLPHKVTPSDTKYVSLERSALKEDFGQSTLPLFDAVPITFDSPSPLGGVGMFHKGVEDYAGFISFRVYGINYKEYLNEFKVFHIINDRVSFNSSFN